MSFGHFNASNHGGVCMYVRDSLRYEVLYPTSFGAIFEVLRAKSALSASLGAYLQLLLELFTIRRVQPIIWF